jgi:hypothetical protein
MYLNIQMKGSLTNYQLTIETIIAKAIFKKRLSTHEHATDKLRLHGDDGDEVVASAAGGRQFSGENWRNRRYALPRARSRSGC